MNIPTLIFLHQKIRVSKACLGDMKRPKASYLLSVMTETRAPTIAVLNKKCQTIGKTQSGGVQRGLLKLLCQSPVGNKEPVAALQLLLDKLKILTIHGLNAFSFGLVQHCLISPVPLSICSNILTLPAFLSISLVILIQ